MIFKRLLVFLKMCVRFLAWSVVVVSKCVVKRKQIIVREVEQ